MHWHLKAFRVPCCAVVFYVGRNVLSAVEVRQHQGIFHYCVELFFQFPDVKRRIQILLAFLALLLYCVALLTVREGLIHILYLDERPVIRHTFQRCNIDGW